jgi:hypothetical protein
MAGAPFAVAFPMVGTVALLVLLLAGIVALQLARRVRQNAEPIFPDAPAVERDPLPFAERLTKGGTFDDDTARFTDVAARAGLQQAYALLARADGDEGSGAPGTPAVRASFRNPMAALAALNDDPGAGAHLATATMERTPEPPATWAQAWAPRAGDPVGERPVEPGLPGIAISEAPVPASRDQAAALPQPDEPAVATERNAASAEDDLLPSRRRGRRAA